MDIAYPQGKGRSQLAVLPVKETGEAFGTHTTLTPGVPGQHRRDTMSRTIRAASLLFVAMLLLCPSLARADSDLKLEGFVSALPTALTLPLAPGAPPVTVTLSLGIPAVTLQFKITPGTEIEAQRPLPVTLVNGDRVEVTAVVTAGALVATKLELAEFPELELRGKAGGLTGGVTLPLAPRSTLDFTLDLGIGGTPLPVRLTGDTKVEGAKEDEGGFTLVNGATIQIEGVVRDSRIVITEISRR